MSYQSSCFLGFNIPLLFFSIAIVVFSIFQLTEGGGYGYDDIIELMNDKISQFRINKIECNEYISKLNFKKDFTNYKIFINLVFNAGIIAYIIARFGKVDKSCEIGILISTILTIGYLTELSSTIISFVYYASTKYDSKDFETCNIRGGSVFIKEYLFKNAKSSLNFEFTLDLIILILICVSFIPLIIGNLCILDMEIDNSRKCIEKDFCWICSIFSCFGNVFNSCCEGCCNSCAMSCNSCCNDCCDGCCKPCEDCYKNKNRDLNGENINLDKKIKELEEENKRLNEEISTIKNSPSPYYLETRIKVIKFYLQKELNQQDVNNFDCKDLFLSEIKNDFGIKFTPQKFSEITLYYINEKVREILSRDSDPQNIFVNPVINRAGKTFEKNMVNENILRENKLVFDIRIILKENKKLEMNNFKQIKKLLLNEEEKFYENPVVNMNGITEEGKPNELYQNLVIKNVIKEIKIFDDEFFENKDIYNFNKSRNKDNDIEIINSKAIFFSEK